MTIKEAKSIVRHIIRTYKHAKEAEPTLTPYYSYAEEKAAETLISDLKKLRGP